MAHKALLHDMTRCIGCRGCQVACKQWNERPAEKTQFFAGPGYQNPGDLSASTYTLITYNEVQISDRFDWVFGKLQCKHCVDPACVQICPVKAITKTDSGAVVVDRDECIGCMQCITACPFGIPRYDADDANRMHKCWLCFDRLSAGEIPACAKACAPKAIEFGDRDTILKEAKQRIANNPDTYINAIYGQEEAGGTCVFHISNVPFEALAFDTNVPKHAVKIARAVVAPTFKEYVAMAGAGPAVFVLGVGWVINRRMEIEKETTKA